MQKIIKDLEKRGIINNITNEEKIKNFQPHNAIYAGFDPTAKSLHLGNYVQIKVLKHFLKANKKVIAILGGATGQIGDPSFNVNERPLLDQETLNFNKMKIKQQLENLGLQVKDNLDFYKDMTMFEFLRDIGKLVNINYMLNKESISSRMDHGLSFTEFSYTLIQGWDFFRLYQDHNVSIQVGGSDQWGNITTGIEIIRKKIGENNAIGIAFNLLTDSNGNKFGKSTGGGSLWLDKEMTSPFAMYQFLLNQSDIEVEKLLLWLTFKSTEEIQQIMDEHQKEPFKKTAQKILASEIIRDIHGQEELDKVLNISQLLFSNSYTQLSSQDIEQLTKVLPVLEVEKGSSLIDQAIAIGACVSRREFREFIQSKTFELDGTKDLDEKSNIDFSLFDQKFSILKKGKKHFFIFKAKNKC